MKLLTKLRQLIRHLKWGRPEARLCLLASLPLAAALWLFNADAFKDSVIQTWLAPALLAVAGLLVSIAFVKLWRLVSPPLETADEIQGPILRGASAFTPQDGEIFKKLGRQEELQKLKDWIQDDQVPLVIVMGESGVGKTSLLRAGVQNLLDEKEVAYWEAVATDPGEKFRRAVRSKLGKNPNGLEKGALLVDQTEQLGADRDVFELLQKHLEADPPYRVTWILAMRREYHYSWVVWSLKHLDESVRHRVRELPVEHFNRDRAKEIFSTLAAEADLTVQETVRDQIIRSIAEGDKVSPVDLAIALQVLGHNPKHAEDPRFFVSIGGHSAMLTSYLEGELQRYTEPEREAVYRALLVLIEEEGEEDQRKADGASVEELHRIARPKTPEVLDHALDHLALPGVRVLERCGTAQDRLRLVHERFIPAVRRLAGAVLTEAEQASRLLARRCAAWSREGEARRFLLRRKELRQVEQELPRLRWGENREGKERLLRASQLRRSLLAIGSVTILFIGLMVALGFRHAQQVQSVKRQLPSWGLPVGLYEALPQVESLFLESARVSNLAWLAQASILHEIHLDFGNVSSLNGLPESLQHLRIDLSDSEVKNLYGLPQGLKMLEIDIQASQVQDLAGLPNSLQELTLRVNSLQARSLNKLPSSLQTLKLTIADLDGPLDRLPPNIENLALDLRYSKVSDLGSLPKHLRALMVAAPRTVPLDLGTLPDSLQQLHLDLSHSEQTKLPTFPKNLDKLSLYIGLSRINNIEQLPSNLTYLDLDLGDSLVASLRGLPDNLKELRLSASRSSLQNLSGIPQNLRRLDLDLSGTKIAGLGQLPQGLQVLSLDLSDSLIQSLVELPASLRHLTLDLDSSKVDDIRGLPQGLIQLELKIGTSEVQDIAGLPESLQQLTLDLQGSHVNSITLLPRNLQHLALDITRSKIRSLEGLPEHLQILNLTAKTYFPWTLRALPRRLRTLRLSEVPWNMTHLDGLPETLQELSINLGRSRVHSLAGLPSGLQELELTLESSAVRNLGSLPATLKKLQLDISNSQVNRLGPLPATLRELTIEVGSSPVKSLTGLPENLDQLTLNLGSAPVSHLEGLPDSLTNIVLILGRSKVKSIEHLPPTATLHLTL